MPTPTPTPTEAKPSPATLRELASSARALAQAAYLSDELQCLEARRAHRLERKDVQTCTDRESKRKGAKFPHHRPWWAFDAEKLCAHCVGYWHAESAAQALEKSAASAERVALEEKWKQEREAAPLFKCAGERCPGLPWKASEQPHPESCNGEAQS